MSSGLGNLNLAKLPYLIGSMVAVTAQCADRGQLAGRRIPQPNQVVGSERGPLIMTFWFPPERAVFGFDAMGMLFDQDGGSWSAVLVRVGVWVLVLAGGHGRSRGCHHLGGCPGRDD